MPAAGAVLGALALFRDLHPAELARIAAASSTHRLGRGDFLFHVGDEPAGFYVVVTGQVKMFFVSPRGDEKVVHVMGPGQSFGEAVMFLQRTYPVSAEALVDTVVLRVDQQAVLGELERDPALARRMIAGLCVRLHGLVGQLGDMLTRSGTERVIGFLLHDCETKHAGSSAQVRLATSKGVLASRLNLTNEHFSRILGDLAARGLIEVHGRQITVPDVARLRAHAP